MTSFRNLQISSLREVYSRTYDERMQMWRHLGSMDKVANISRMLAARSSGIESVLEVGCGNGAVLQSITRALPNARNLVGIEITDERAAEAVSQLTDTKFALRSYDGVHIPYEAKSFDFVYATHVLEHVVHERRLLAEVNRVVSKLAYFEVPLELVLGTSIGKLQRTLNIGHINAYSMESFQLLLETSGFKLLDLQLFSHSWAVEKFGKRTAIAAMKYFTRHGVLAMLGKRMASRLVSYHCGALCEPAPLLDIA